eukprot:g5400.t1
MLYVIGVIALTVWIRDHFRSESSVYKKKRKKRRNAEKRRKRSTCAFADEIAKRSIDLFERVGDDLAPSKRKSQTVMSTFCATIGEKTIKVLSMGVGTKIREERYEGNGGLRDMHAEVIARRGFQRFLLNEMLNIEHSDILERVSSTFRLKSNVRIHQYTSSAPCGNATIRRWGHEKEPQSDKMSLPDQSHELLHCMAIREGQISTLVKTSRSRRGIEETKRMGFVESTDRWSVWQRSHSDSRKKKRRSNKTYSSRGTSCAPTWTKAGTIMTCSDKIAKWNALGLQGSLLTGLMSRVDLTSLTCGRKFNFLHCRRALCCRLEVRKKKSKQCLSRINHPILMQTSIPMDNSEIELNEDSEGSANFSDSRCLLWIANQKNSTVLLDGNTGLLLGTSDGIPCISHKELHKHRDFVLKTFDFDTKQLDIDLKQYNTEKSFLLSESFALRHWVCCKTTAPPPS